MSENAFFRDNESLYEKSLALNCQGVHCLDNNYLTANKEELKKILIVLLIIQEK